VSVFTVGQHSLLYSHSFWDVGHDDQVAVLHMTVFESSSQREILWITKLMYNSVPFHRSSPCCYSGAWVIRDELSILHLRLGTK